MSNFYSVKYSIVHLCTSQNEAVPESLKNVLLVMNAVGILVPPGPNQDDLQKTLWSNTHERMERFLPGFLVDIIPIPPEM